MASERRMGAEGSATWSLLLDAAESLMRQKGYPAVTSRQLGKEAGLSPQIVYFYFKTMDDVFEAVFKRIAASLFEALESAALATDPILAMWKISSDPSRSSLMIEIMSLANHRPALRKHIEEFGTEYNRRQVQILEKELGEGAENPLQIPANVVASIFENLGRSFSFSQSFDIASHSLAREFVTTLIECGFRKT